MIAVRIRLPRTLDGSDPPGIAIDVAGETVLPDDDGHYDIGDRRAWLESFAAANDCDADDLVVDGADADSDDATVPNVTAATCDAVKSDGEVCGRELPCRYHSGDA